MASLNPLDSRIRACPIQAAIVLLLALPCAFIRILLTPKKVAPPLELKSKVKKSLSRS